MTAIAAAEKNEEKNEEKNGAGSTVRAGVLAAPPRPPAKTVP